MWRPDAYVSSIGISMGRSWRKLKSYSNDPLMDHWRFDPGSKNWVFGASKKTGRCVLLVFPKYDFHLGVVESDCFSPCAPCIWEDAGMCKFDSFKIYVPIGFDIVGIIVDTFQELRTCQNQRMCGV